jgi:tRNA threonylcarbamoyladenosine biosynthesis protein TsaB
MSFNLYIDTSGPQSTILLFDENKHFAIRQNSIQNDHSKFIHSHIDEVMNELNISYKDLQTVCVLNGPGSYTGLRISLATAKGIAYAHSLPLVLINKLDLLASIVNTMNSFGVVIEAREKEYFFALFDAQKKYIIEPSMISEEDLLILCEEKKITLFTSGNKNEAQKLDFKTLLYNEKNIIDYCLNEIQEKNYADLFISEPFYMKNVYINKINKL